MLTLTVEFDGGMFSGGIGAGVVPAYVDIVADLLS